MFFTIEKIAKQLPEICAAIPRHVYPISRFKFHEGECVGAEQPDYDDRHWPDFCVGDSWGGYDVVAWFRARVPLPRQAGQHPLALRLVVGPRDGGDSTAETLLYVNGQPLQGLDAWHDQAWLPPEHLQHDSIHIALKAWSGVLGVPERRRFETAQLVSIDQDTECFYHLAHTLLKAVQVLDENDLARTRLLQALNDSFLQIDFSEPRSAEFYQSVAQADASLRARMESLRKVGEIKPTVVGVGHAHLDMAWLWRLRHTRDKAARTFSTALHLMRQYPEYRFLHSSPQLYQFLKQDYPEIYARVRDKIASGQWEISGGMWVEPDTNIPGGESLVRQVLLAKRFTREEFGLESRVLWMPDVFGYSAALPQILRKSGLDVIVTTKISWNQFNRFPYDTFQWRGLDGTEILAHFITTPEPHSRIQTYNGALAPLTVKGVWDQYRQKDVNDKLLLCYGAGDGGGGPTKEMLESAQVMQNLPGLPRLELDQAESFFSQMLERLNEKQLPVWDGELYLEYHRGTYTSQAANKRANREAEALYHQAEFVSTLADVLTAEQKYPAASLREGWELILLNQFHDILPGSSIRAVYEDSQKDYARIRQIGTRASEQAEETIVRQIPAAGPSLVVFNSLGWSRDELVLVALPEETKGMTVQNDQGLPIPSQIVRDHGKEQVLILAEQVPAYGYRTLPLARPDILAIDPEPMVIAPDVLESQNYRIKLDRQGRFTSLYDKVNSREVLAPGACGNVLQVFEDKPLAFDAWDIDIYYQEKMKEIDHLVEAVVEEQGPLRGVLRLCWRFHDSVIAQRITLYRHSPRIDFRTEVEWQEKQTLLKVAFPIAVRSTRATYDIQFGNIERPTHWNTSWDYARFEVVGHKWADLSEGNYGVSLLNDCKYGYDIKGHVMRLTLIKSAIRPDALADKGHHEFTYSLLPHAGDWRQAQVVQQAYALNNPMSARLIAEPQPGDLPSRYQFASVDTDGIIVETIKQAEDGDGWIVRVYETKQCRYGQVQLRFGQPVRRAVECDLLERDDKPVSFSARELTFPIMPFEIKTFRVWF